MKKKPATRGFTLVELLVVMTLILVITTYSIAGYFPFMTKIEYENVVMDIALNIREHQIYGIGTKQATTNVFDYGYGFRVEATGRGVLFFRDNWPDNNPAGPSDLDGNGLYEPATPPLLNCTTPVSSDECLKLISMNGYTVRTIVVFSGATPTTFNTAGQYVDVTFKRPYLEAKILANGASATSYDRVHICIDDDAGAVERHLKIEISRTGQMSMGVVADPAVCQ